MDKNEEFKLTGPELQSELLKRMEYRDESPQCRNCKSYYSGMGIDRCTLNPIMELSVNDLGYCNFYQKAKDTKG